MAETQTEAQGEAQTVTLRKPIFAEGVKMNAVTIEPLTIGQQFDARRKHPNDPAEQERLLISYSAGVAPETIDQADVRDYVLMQNALMGFMQDQPSQNATTSSPSAGSSPAGA